MVMAHTTIFLLRPVLVLITLSCFFVSSLWAEDLTVNFSYVLELEAIDPESYSGMTGIMSQSQVIDRIITGPDGEVIVTKEPGKLSLTGFTMTRELSENLTVWDWRKIVQEGRIEEAKQNGSVIMLDDAENQIARWNFMVLVMYT